MDVLHEHGADDAAGDADEGAAEDLGKGVLSQYHSAGHDASRNEDGEAEPPDGVETEDGGIGHQCAYDTSGACCVHAHFPPHVHQHAGALYE